MSAKALDDLPPEIINHIVEHIDDLRTLVNLSVVSKRFHEYVLQDGYRVFILQHYPAYEKAGSWIDAVKSLTALSRAWTKKAFLARNLRPTDNEAKINQFLVSSPTTRRAISHGRQSMGYQPVIDCFETWTSGLAHEVLTWGAGAELILRVKNEVSKGKILRDESNLPLAQPLKGDLQWTTYKPPDMIDGRDDITAAKLLRPHQVADDDKQHVIVGRASGHMHCLSFSNASIEVKEILSGAGTIDCADVNKSNDPVVAACLDNKKISVHRLHATDTERTVFEFEDHKKSDTIWTVRFLSASLLAVGQGSTKRPLSLLRLTPEGLMDMNFPEIPYNVSDAIYAIEPLADTQHLFLTGHYSGHVQLNDMRIPNGRAAVYDDPVDCSPIYSLLPMVGPRFVAGGARHCLLKFFDMRRANWSCSSYTTGARHHARGGYNIFLPTIGTRMTRTSPTYCLAASSPHAGTFYAGIENGIVQIDLHSAHDALARPNGGIPLLDRSQPDPAQLEKETESLRLVEHATEGVPVLLRQANLTYRERRKRVVLDYDERWAEDIGYDSDASVRRVGRSGRVNGTMERRRFS